MASRPTLSMMPWRLAYWPVRIDARLGEHSGVVWKAFANCAPSCASRSMCGVFMYGCPEAPVSSKRRSSMRMTRRLGFMASSLRLDAELARKLAPAFDVGADHCGELARRAAHRLQRRLRQALPDLAEREHLRRFHMKFLNHFVTRAARRKQAQPLRGLEAREAGFVQRGNVRHRREALERSESEDADAPGLVVRDERSRAEHPDRHLTRDEVLHRRPAALV